MKRFLIGLAILALFALFLAFMILTFGSVPGFAQSPITDPAFACIVACVESGKDPVECGTICNDRRPFPTEPTFKPANLEVRGYLPIIRKDKPPPPRPKPTRTPDPITLCINGCMHDYPFAGRTICTAYCYDVGPDPATFFPTPTPEY